MKRSRALAAATFVLLAAFFSLPSAATAQTLRFGLWPRGARSSLQLVRHEIELTVRHPTAQVVVTQVFENPHPRALEAYYYYPLPPGATVSDVVLWVNGEPRHARVLERQRAREIYQSIVDEKRDPALMERLAGGLFRIRIFPVPARGRQKVQIRYVQPVEALGRGRYRALVRRPPGPVVHALVVGAQLIVDRAHGRPELRDARLRGYRARARRELTTGRRWLPTTAAQSFSRDIAVTYALGRPAAERALVHRTAETTTFAALLPDTSSTRKDLPTALLVDISASMAARQQRARALAARVLRSLPDGRRVTLLPFDLLLRARPQFAPLSSARRGELVARLARLHAGELGSAFVPAIEAAIGAGARHVVLISDGGRRGHQAELEHLLRLLFDRRGVALSVIHLADPGSKTPTPARLTAANQRAERDGTAAWLRDLARVSGGLYVRPSGARLAPADERKLAALSPAPTPRLATRSVRAAGSLHVVRRFSAGALVVGRLAGHPHAVAIALGDGRQRRIELGATTAAESRAEVALASHPAVALWATAQIERLTTRIKLFGEKETLRARIVELAKRHRVASEYTAFLVTEKDSDYDRRTSGRRWQRRVHRMGDGAPDFHSTPEPHELLLVGLVLLMVVASRRYRRLRC